MFFIYLSYVLGTAMFETLVDLIAHYQKHPLYRRVRKKSTFLNYSNIYLFFCGKTRLSVPVNEELLSDRGLNGFMHSDEVYGAGIANNPVSFF